MDAKDQKKLTATELAKQSTVDDVHDSGDEIEEPDDDEEGFSGFDISSDSESEEDESSEYESEAILLTRKLSNQIAALNRGKDKDLETLKKERDKTIEVHAAALADLESLLKDAKATAEKEQEISRRMVEIRAQMEMSGRDFDRGKSRFTYAAAEKIFKALVSEIVTLQAIIKKTK